MILPPVFHSLEIKPMMFLHLVRSFGSKTVKLPHVFAFSGELTFVPPALFERDSKKCTAKKCTKCEWSKRGPKRRKECLLPDGKTTWLTAAFTGRGVQKGNLKLGCVVCQKFLQKQVAGGSIPTTKETSVRHKFALSTCLWQTYRAIIQTIYTGMSHFDSCASNVGLGRIRVVQWLCPG